MINTELLSIIVVMLSSIGRFSLSLKIQCGTTLMGTSIRTFLSSLNDNLRDEVELPLPLRRFWSKEVTLNASDEYSALRAVKCLMDKGSVHAADDLTRTENGLVLIPQLDMVIPFLEGQIQTQHSTKCLGMRPDSQLQDSKSVTFGEMKALICGFSRRAQSFHADDVESPERPVSMERKKALDSALVQLGLDVTADDLLGSEYVGTPPSRIYRSFVCPRKPKDGVAHPFVESLDRLAVRMADQINFALRQVRADRAKYLRNIDRCSASSTPSAASSSSASSAAASDEPNIEEKSDTPRTAAVVHPVVLLLDNIRSAENVGSLFRSAETAGAAAIITCGITPHPPHPKISKTALQSAEVVPTRHYLDPIEAVRALQADGYTIVVMETTSLSQRYTRVEYPKKVAFVLGNEVTGVDTRLLAMADLVVEIPTYGVKNSLNVASAAAVVLFEVIRQWHLDD